MRERVQGQDRERACGQARRPARRRAAGELRARGLFPLLLLAALGGVPRAAEAATLTGHLPSSATTAHLLFLDCSDEGVGAPLSATVQVRDLAPVAAPIVSVQLRKGTAATSSTDAVDGDAGASPLVFVNGGAGRYDIFVDKTAAGGEAYEVVAQCWTGAAGTGLATGTALSSAAGAPVPFSSLPGQLALLAGLGWIARRALGRARSAREAT